MLWLFRQRQGMRALVPWTAVLVLMWAAVLSSMRCHVLVYCPTPSPVRQVTVSIICCVFIIRCLSLSTSIDTATTRQPSFRLASTMCFLCIFLCSDTVGWVLGWSSGPWQLSDVVLAGWWACFWYRGILQHIWPCIVRKFGNLQK